MLHRHQLQARNAAAGDRIGNTGCTGDCTEDCTGDYIEDYTEDCIEDYTEDYTEDCTEDCIVVAWDSTDCILSRLEDNILDSPGSDKTSGDLGQIQRFVCLIFSCVVSARSQWQIRGGDMNIR